MTISSAILLTAATTLVPDTLADVQALGEVTVKADHITITPNKMIVSVGNMVRRNAYDGYSALSLLGIPGLDVSTIDNTVTTYGENVKLCINGLNADPDEVKTLNPKDIIRIDYYTNYNPDHPSDQFVLDFIIRVRDSGGAVMIQANQQLNQPTGSGLADWRMYLNRSEFGVRLNGGYSHATHTNPSGSTRTLLFPAGPVSRNESVHPSSVHAADISGKATYVYRFDHGILKAAASIGSDHTRLNNAADVTYTGVPYPASITTEATHRDQLYPAVQLSYEHKFPNKASLRVQMKGRFSSNNLDRDYIGANRYYSTTGEKYLGLAPDIRFTLPIGKKWSTYAQAMYW